MTVQPSVEKVIKEFHSAKKPIGLELKIHLLYLSELTLINSNPSQRRIKNTSFYEILPSSIKLIMILHISSIFILSRQKGINRYNLFTSNIRAYIHINYVFDTGVTSRNEGYFSRIMCINPDAILFQFMLHFPSSGRQDHSGLHRHCGPGQRCGRAMAVRRYSGRLPKHGRQAREQGRQCILFVRWFMSFTCVIYL